MPEASLAMTPTTLQAVWFALWGLLWAIYLCLDGFDLGAGILLPILARSEEERMAVHRAIEPYWDGNEVWLVTAGGVTFAAFPGAYAVMFSALYTPLMLILFALIVRGAIAAFRPSAASGGMRRLCDGLFSASSLVAALLLGVAFANLFRGLPLLMNGTLEGGILALLREPVALVGGGLILLAIVLHGALWLSGKTEGALAIRAAKLARILWLAVAVLGTIFFYLCYQHTGLFQNFMRYSWLLALIPMVSMGLLVAGLGVFLGQPRFGWWGSSLLLTGVVMFGMAGIYPVMLPSRLNPEWGVRIATAASSPPTLRIMLVVVLVFLPLVMVYQAWVYWVMRGPVRGEEGAGY